MHYSGECVQRCAGVHVPAESEGIQRLSQPVSRVPRISNLGKRPGKDIGQLELSYTGAACHAVCED